MYCNKTLEEYLNDLAAKLPAPGGGSAAALNAALGVSLISMVVNFTMGKPKYSLYEHELKKILNTSEKLREEFIRLVDLDVVAYKSKNIRDCLDVPFMIVRLCYEAAKLCPPLLRKGNINLISDVACAAIALEAAFSSASFNVEINLKAFPDKKFSHKIRKELAQKARKIKKIRQDTEVSVGKIIRR